MSEASRRAELIITLARMSDDPYEKCVERVDKVVADAISRAVEGERERVMTIFDDYFAPDDDDPMVARCRAALRAPGEKA